MRRIQRCGHRQKNEHRRQVMKKVWQIFIRDCRRLLRNPVAVIVAVGICIIPSLYAWFNIAANFDPMQVQGISRWQWQTVIKAQRMS